MFIELGAFPLHLMNDDSLGTTAGRRFHLAEDTNDLAISNLIRSQSYGFSKVVVIDPYFTCRDDCFLRGTMRETSGWHTRIDVDQQVVDVFSTPIPSQFLGKFSYGEASICDTTCITAFFGGNDVRVTAAQVAYEKLQQQSLKCMFVFVELLFGDEKSKIKIDQDAFHRHIILRGNDSNIDLFQKEAMWNYGARACPSYIDKFIFIDSDVYPQKTSSFAKCRKILEYNSEAVVQVGDYVVTQKHDSGEIGRIQMLWVEFMKMRASASYCFGPGLSYAISKKVFDRIDGFNPFGIMYGGDILFLIETCKESHPIYAGMMNSSLCTALRKIKEDLKFYNVSDHMIHVWHGDHSDRAYWVWEYFLTKIGFDIRKRVEVDSNGLVKWKHREPIVNEFLREKQRMHSRADVDVFLKELQSKQLLSSKFDIRDQSTRMWTKNLEIDGCVLRHAAGSGRAVMSIYCDRYKCAVDFSSRAEYSIVIDGDASKCSPLLVSLNCQSGSNDFCETNDILVSDLKIPLSRFSSSNLKGLMTINLKFESGELTLREVRIEK